MNAIIISFVLLVAVPLLSLAVTASDFDDRDRRGWWPGVRAR
jgi:uncharacterized membrane protein YhaH (DUF805 family)